MPTFWSIPFPGELDYSWTHPVENTTRPTIWLDYADVEVDYETNDNIGKREMEKS